MSILIVRVESDNKISFNHQKYYILFWVWVLGMFALPKYSLYFLGIIFLMLLDSASSNKEVKMYLRKGCKIKMTGSKYMLWKPFVLEVEK